jgi:hypothetical protein
MTMGVGTVLTGLLWVDDKESSMRLGGITLVLGGLFYCLCATHFRVAADEPPVLSKGHVLQSIFMSVTMAFNAWLIKSYSTSISVYCGIMSIVLALRNSGILILR